MARTIRPIQGMADIEHVGQRNQVFSDTYHWLMTLSWTGMLGLLAAVYVAFNALFAALYLAGGDCFNAEHPGNFLEAFSFSVQTMSGIGYGAMNPTTPYAHAITIVEAFTGLAGLAMATGLMFAKFARPNARVEFANHPVIQTRDGQPVLMLRMANRRRNQVVDARVQVVALVDTVTAEGEPMRRVIDLPLVRQNTPAFTMSWTLMHEIDEDSPLYGLDVDSESSRVIGIIVNFIGIDDTFAQTVHAQRIFYTDEIRVGYRYRDMIENVAPRHLRVHHDRLHDIQSVNTQPGTEDP